MTEPNLAVVLQAISQMDDSQLDAVNDAVRRRHRTIRQDAAAVASAALQIGDRVRIERCSPAYLNGCVGRVTSRVQTKFTVMFEDDLTTSRARHRFGSTVTVPASCLAKLD